VTKKALIVDDSKTARQVLSNKLQKYGIAVDARESAAAAIDYLYDNAPDAIFMDYEMPGMDGFQALKVIKSNPYTAVIPVMMYTSKEGGLALSQARALGAVGVLPKQLEPQDFEDVLSALHLMPEQDSLVHDFKSESLDTGRRVRTDNVHPISDHERHKPAKVEMVGMPADSFQQTLSAGESLKRFFRREQSMSEERLQQRLDKQFAELHSEMYELEAMQEELAGRGSRAFFGGILGGVIALVAGVLIYGTVSDQGFTQSARVDKQLMEMVAQQNDKIEQLSAKIDVPLGAQGEQQQAEVVLPLKLIEWAANQGSEFAYNVRPFNDERALWLSELVGQLKESGFQGTLELRSNHGNFCLRKGADGEMTLAPSDMPLSECVYAIDNRSNNEWLNDQSVAFANYINVELGRSGGEVEIILFSNGFEEPLVPYPADYEVSNAGEWNEVAARNQRIQVSLYGN
jgi:CheY-like chemotaxis protein